MKFVKTVTFIINKSNNKDGMVALLMTATISLLLLCRDALYPDDGATTLTMSWHRKFSIWDFS